MVQKIEIESSKLMAMITTKQMAFLSFLHFFQVSKERIQLVTNYFYKSTVI